MAVMVRRALVIASLLALPGSVADAADAKRVAILYFDNDTKDAELDLLRKGMADMLITDLSDLDGVTIVEREKLEALLAEQKLQRSKYFDPKTAVKLGRGAGATHAVTGAFNAVGSKLRVDVRLVEVATGNVVATEKVVGQKKAFFTLQQRLAVAFACRLAEQRCGTKPSGKGPSLGTVRKYAKGLDLADSGKLKEATKTLQGVVTSAPNFKPAAETYRRIMKQLYAARSSRTDQLGDVRQKLQAKVDAVARADRLGQAKGIDEATVGRWVGYRVLGTQLVLQQIDAHFRVLAQAGASADSGQEKFAKLVERYRTQVDRLATDVEKYAAKHPGSGLPDCTLDDEDTALGKKLGLGDEPGVVSFYSPVRMRRDLGSFLTTGEAPFWGTFRFSKDIKLYTVHRIDSGVRVGGAIEYRDVPRPPVERLHDRFSKAAIRQFEAALAGAAKMEDGDDRQTATIDVLDAYAKGLVALRRPVEAVARWQSILERYPKYESYDEVEAKIRAALGE